MLHHDPHHHHHHHHHIVIVGTRAVCLFSLLSTPWLDPLIRPSPHTETRSFFRLLFVCSFPILMMMMIMVCWIIMMFHDGHTVCVHPVCSETHYSYPVCALPSFCFFTQTVLYLYLQSVFVFIFIFISAVKKNYSYAVCTLPFFFLVLRNCNCIVCWDFLL